MRAFVGFLILFTASAANYDGDVFVYNNNNDYISNRSATEQVHQFKFGYYNSAMLNIDLHLKNKPENVIVDAYLNYPTGYTKHYQEKDKIEEKRRKYFEISHYLVSNVTKIEIELSTNSGFCIRKEIVTATKLTTRTNKETRDEVLAEKLHSLAHRRNVALYFGKCAQELHDLIPLSPFHYRSTRRIATSTGYHPHLDNIPPCHYDICLNSKPCVIEVDLSNTVCKEDAKQMPAQWNVIIYVIPTMIIACVIALVVYISFKKYSHRISEETIENNTSARNEVVYAALSLENGHGEPPIRHESPYAQIVGVMRPVLSRK